MIGAQPIFFTREAHLWYACMEVMERSRFRVI